MTYPKVVPKVISIINKFISINSITYAKWMNVLKKWPIKTDTRGNRIGIVLCSLNYQIHDRKEKELPYKTWGIKIPLIKFFKHLRSRQQPSTNAFRKSRGRKIVLSFILWSQHTFNTKLFKEKTFLKKRLLMTNIDDRHVYQNP